MASGACPGCIIGFAAIRVQTCFRETNWTHSPYSEKRVTLDGISGSMLQIYFGDFGCPPGIRTPIGCSRGSCPTIERGGSKRKMSQQQSADYTDFMMASA
jgi:hypothetical protein